MMTIIAAVAADRAIGRAGDLLWHLPADLKHFKALTMGKCVVMGRATWESLPRRPLPGRRNIVITSNPGYIAEGAETFTTPEAAFESARAGGDDFFVIGGGRIYARALTEADALELTEIHAEAPDADTWFPALNPSGWVKVSSEDFPDAEPPYSFVRYERRGQ
ncbi:MAG: dihydrofolate reductase [Bacteroides sp.]|nr:dihydrofolate reductase [Bacteroides sp.]